MYNFKTKKMMTVICMMILVYLIKGKEIDTLLEKLKDIDWKDKTNQLYAKIRPYAQKYGRVAARPLLQFYYVLQDGKTTLTERAMIYAAIIYTLSPVNLLPKAVYGFLGILDEGTALLFVYNKIKEKITPEIDYKVNESLNEWFGAEYEIIED